MWTQEREKIDLTNAKIRRPKRRAQVLVAVGVVVVWNSFSLFDVAAPAFVC